MNRASVFEWHKRFKEGRKPVKDNERCGRSKEVNTPQLAKGLRLGLGLLCWGFKGVLEEIPEEEASTRQIGSVAFPPGQCTSPQLHPVTDYLTKLDTKTVPHPSYSPDLGPCDFWLSLSLEVVGMRQLRRWKKLWRRSLTHSHKRISMGLSRSCWNGTTNALQPEEITS